MQKIPKQMLQKGMFIEEFCGSWMEHPFWRSRFVLASDDDLARILQSSITELWIDPTKGLGLSDAEARALPAVEEPNLEQLAASEAKAKPQRVSMGEELARARKICDRARSAVEQMFSEARMGKAVDAEHCKAMVEEISTSVSRNPGALISLARLKTADEYTYMHSVAVCALMIALARELALPEDQVKEAGLAGLLHDMGKALIPMSILNKAGKLTDAEFDIVKQHPKKGYELLVEAGNASQEVMDACLHHHEKTDGSGYPHKLLDADISLIAKMTAVCDVYDAITSNRPYKKGWDPAESIKKMAEWSKGHFDEAVFQGFVKSLGIYPVGSLVRLQSNRLGIVVEQSPGALLKPKVKVFFSVANNTRIAPVLLDLASSKVDEKIVSREPTDKWAFKDLDELWQVE
ncbi:HD-GYP domain-containing protein [Simiduia curdlanivorans]|uniref:HD-GYP domain-containing protein n=1 Tax=Simiduia curdlanivorans TaxID=1492769 RepID=A0ABV8VAY2_9GAMM|nr:HD-GYP domain-containing protein [Simiduia curdlanivorans]MDN3638530.1 HD-GYP domain-containing protein [Simiduia curdlanivorans]